MARSIEEQTAFEAARTVYAFCLAVENQDSDGLTELRSADRTRDEWKAVAEQAISALMGAVRIQAHGCGVSTQAFCKSSIQALLSLEALGGPPAALN